MFEHVLYCSFLFYYLKGLGPKIPLKKFLQLSFLHGFPLKLNTRRLQMPFDADEVDSCAANGICSH